MHNENPDLQESSATGEPAPPSTFVTLRGWAPMKRLSAQMQMYIAIGVIVLAALAVIVLAIVPKFQESQNVRDQIATAEMNLSTAQALLARRQSVKAQAAATEVELMQIANQLPDSPQLPSVIIELQDAANAAGVELPSISVSGVENAPPAEDGSSQPFHVLPLTVEYTGQWVDIIDFGRRLGQLERGVRVKSTTYTYVAETEDVKAHIKASGTIEVYMMPGASTSTPAGQ